MTTDSRQLEDFRISASQEIEAWLRQLLGQHTRLQLSTPGGASLETRLWSLDIERHSMGFEIDTGAPALQALLDSAEVMAVAYLDQIRLEFEIDALVLVQSPALSTLRAPWPAALYRFQRRQAYRVQPLGSAYPRVLLNHPHHPERTLCLRVLDLSVSGLALLLGADLPPIETVVALPLDGLRARIELDSDIHFETTLRLQHLGDSTLGPDGQSSGQRLGCAFAALPSGAERALQLYIDQTQKRQRLLKKS
jgi:flagellar brake protein